MIADFSCLKNFSRRAASAMTTAAGRQAASSTISVTCRPVIQKAEAAVAATIRHAGITPARAHSRAVSIPPSINTGTKSEICRRPINGISAPTATASTALPAIRPAGICLSCLNSKSMPPNTIMQYLL